MNIILENTQYRDAIRNVIKDIITIFKNNDEGEFYLPEDLNPDRMTYIYPKLKYEFSVDLIIEEDFKIQDFKVNAEYSEGDTITVLIHYNPKYKKSIIYDLVGELNEIVAHEIRHIHQDSRGHFYMGDPEKDNSYEYYTQPKELDALNFGFKRMSKITKKPIADLVDNWFNKNEDIHMLNDKEKKDVINKILKYRR
jgi:hypothetical protein